MPPCTRGGVSLSDDKGQGVSLVPPYTPGNQGERPVLSIVLLFQWWFIGGGAIACCRCVIHVEAYLAIPLSGTL
jgi:hypothetical protein